MSDTQKLLAACVEYRAKLDELERENAALRKAHDAVVLEFRKVDTENAELREDKARLDWIAVSETWFDVPANEGFTPQSFRAAIDAARKEAQP